MSLPARFGKLPDDHCVPDLLDYGLKVVFCGTALGRKSAEQKAYYANPTNYFWPALHAIGLTPHQLKPADYPQLLFYGIGLTDLCKTDYGNDAELPEQAFDVDALDAKIREFQPRVLAFTSKTGAAAYMQAGGTGGVPYGLQETRVGDTKIFVLPSPSGQARSHWKPGPWQALATLLRHGAE